MDAGITRLLSKGCVYVHRDIVIALVVGHVLLVVRVMSFRSKGLVHDVRLILYTTPRLRVVSALTVSIKLPKEYARD